MEIVVNKNLQKLAKKAGFVFWSDESWGPGKNNIDWANEYDEDFEKYSYLLIQECVNLVKESDNKLECLEKIHNHFFVSK